MTKREIIKGNKLIGNFMGKNFKDPLNYLYDKSWDWLMPVVEKIRDNNCIVSIRLNRKLNTTTTTISCFEIKWHKYLSVSGVGIESTYKAVVEFIKWYNKQNKK